jgi:hypothetical protein
LSFNPASVSRLTAAGVNAASIDPMGAAADGVTVDEGVSADKASNSVPDTASGLGAFWV